MMEKRKPEGPEGKLEGAKLRKATIISMENRIKELKKAISETNNELTRKLYSQELDLVTRKLEQFIKNPSGKPFDEFASLTDYSK